MIADRRARDCRGTVNNVRGIQLVNTANHATNAPSIISSSSSNHPSPAPGSCSTTAGRVTVGVGRADSREESEADLLRKYEAATAMSYLAFDLFKQAEPHGGGGNGNGGGGGEPSAGSGGGSAMDSPTSPCLTHTPPPPPVERGFPHLTTTTSSSTTSDTDGHSLHSHFRFRHHLDLYTGVRAAGAGSLPVAPGPSVILQLHRQAGPGLPARTSGRDGEAGPASIGPTTSSRTVVTSQPRPRHRAATSEHNEQTEASQTRLRHDSGSESQPRVIGDESLHRRDSGVDGHSGKSPSPPAGSAARCHPSGEEAVVLPTGEGRAKYRERRRRRPGAGLPSRVGLPGPAWPPGPRGAWNSTPQRGPSFTGRQEGAMTLKRPLVVVAPLPPSGRSRNCAKAEKLCVADTDLDAASAVTSQHQYMKQVTMSLKLPLKKRKYISVDVDDDVVPAPCPGERMRFGDPGEGMHLHSPLAAQDPAVSLNAQEPEKKLVHLIRPRDLVPAVVWETAAPATPAGALQPGEHLSPAQQGAGQDLSDREGPGEAGGECVHEQVVREAHMSSLSRIVHRLSVARHKESTSREFDLQLKKMAHAAFASSSPPQRRTVPSSQWQSYTLREVQSSCELREGQSFTLPSDTHLEMLQQLQVIMPQKLQPDLNRLYMPEQKSMMELHNAQQPLDLTKKKPVLPSTFSPMNKSHLNHSKVLSGSCQQGMVSPLPRRRAIKTEEGASMAGQSHSHEQSCPEEPIVKTEGPEVNGMTSGSKCGEEPEVMGSFHEGQKEAASPAQVKGEVDGSGAAEPKLAVSRSPQPLPSRLEPSSRRRTKLKLAVKPDEDGDLPLHIAVVQGEVQVVEKLLSMMKESLMSVDYCNNLRQTPLHLAIITKEVAIVKMLLLSGASPDLPDRCGNSSTHLSIKHKSMSCLLALMQHARTKPNLNLKNYDGLTPLHLAVQTSATEMVSFLLSSGASIDITDGKSGRTPLLHASENQQTDMVELLLSHRAKVNVQTYAGNTALHVASERSYKDIMTLLVKYGADTTIKNANHETYNSVGKDGKSSAFIKELSSGHLTTASRILIANPGADGSTPTPPKKVYQKRSRSLQLPMVYIKQESISSQLSPSLSPRIDLGQSPRLRLQDTNDEHCRTLKPRSEAGVLPTVKQFLTHQSSLSIALRLSSLKGCASRADLKAGNLLPSSSIKSPTKSASANSEPCDVDGLDKTSATTTTTDTAKADGGLHSPRSLFSIIPATVHSYSSPITRVHSEPVALQQNEWTTSSSVQDTKAKCNTTNTTKSDNSIKLALTRPDLFKNLKKEFELDQRTLGGLRIFQDKRKVKPSQQILAEWGRVQHSGPPAPISSLTTMVKDLSAQRSYLPPQKASVCPSPEAALSLSMCSKLTRSKPPLQEEPIQEPTEQSQCTNPVGDQQHSPHSNAKGGLSLLSVESCKLSPSSDATSFRHDDVSPLEKEKQANRQTHSQQQRGVSSYTVKEGNGDKVTVAVQLKQQHQDNSRRTSSQQGLSISSSNKLTTSGAACKVSPRVTPPIYHQQAGITYDAAHNIEHTSSPIMVDNPLTEAPVMVVLSGTALSVSPNPISASHPKKVKVAGTITPPRGFDSIQNQLVSDAGLMRERDSPIDISHSALKSTARTESRENISHSVSETKHTQGKNTDVPSVIRELPIGFIRGQADAVRPVTLTISNPITDSTGQILDRTLEVTNTTNSCSPDDPLTPEFLRPLIICEDADNQEQPVNPSKRKRRRIHIEEEVVAGASSNRTSFECSLGKEICVAVMKCEPVADSIAVIGADGVGRKTADHGDMKNLPCTDKTSRTTSLEKPPVPPTSNIIITTPSGDGTQSVIDDKNRTVSEETTNVATPSEDNYHSCEEAHQLAGHNCSPPVSLAGVLDGGSKSCLI